MTAPSNLYSNSTVALDVQTGKLKWYYQHLPGDDWDADENHERILVRTAVSPDPAKVKWINPAIKRGSVHDIVVMSGEGGGVFALDRDAGKFLWAQPFPFDNPLNAIKDIDVKTGATRINSDVMFKKDGDINTVCPYNSRSMWQMSYLPTKNALFIPYNDQCLRMQAKLGVFKGYGLREGILRPGSDPDKFMGISRVDLTTGEMKVIYSQPQPTNGSALTTAGNLLFFGDLNRRLRAIDPDTGKVLWETVVGGMIITSTITYAVNGRQYVMVFTGEGMAGGASTAPLKIARKSMPEPVHGHNAIYVFALPGKTD